MDWIGDKLAMLIEQGKRALNAEVVVMSDAKEDEVDDGMGAWEEEDNGVHATRPRSRSVRHAGSVRRPRALDLRSASPRKAAFDHTNAHASGSTSASPYVSHFAPSSAPVYATPMKTHNRGVSVESGMPSSSSLYGHFPGSYSSTSVNDIGTEDPAGWESPELKESMEKARARLLARRMGST